jgi:hypothetical protein
MSIESIEEAQEAIVDIPDRHIERRRAGARQFYAQELENWRKESQEALEGVKGKQAELGGDLERLATTEKSCLGAIKGIEAERKRYAAEIEQKIQHIRTTEECRIRSLPVERRVTPFGPTEEVLEMRRKTDEMVLPLQHSLKMTLKMKEGVKKEISEFLVETRKRIAWQKNAEATLRRLRAEAAKKLAKIKKDQTREYRELGITEAVPSTCIRIEGKEEKTESPRPDLNGRLCRHWPRHPKCWFRRARKFREKSPGKLPRFPSKARFGSSK